MHGFCSLLPPIRRNTQSTAIAPYGLALINYGLRLPALTQAERSYRSFAFALHLLLMRFVPQRNLWPYDVLRRPKLNKPTTPEPTSQIVGGSGTGELVSTRLYEIVMGTCIYEVFG